MTDTCKNSSKEMIGGNVRRSEILNRGAAADKGSASGCLARDAANCYNSFIFRPIKPFWDATKSLLNLARVPRTK